jgi:nucleotide-binding universal stress UspA family protein
MKKILVVAGVSGIKPQTLDFATYIAGMGKSKLEGLFLENNFLPTTPSIKTIGGEAYVEEVIMGPEEKQQYEEHLNKKIALFEERCTGGQEYLCAHKRGYNSVDDIIKETRYADLLITDPGASFDGVDASLTTFVKELMEDAECPVLIAPDNFKPITEIILAFDGSKSSVFAIKQFYYQMPELIPPSTIKILHVAENNGDDEYKAARIALDDLLRMHFLKVQHVELLGTAKEEIYKYMLEQRDMEGKMLVTGAYGRSRLSTLFRASTTDMVLKAVDVPVFVAHG